MLRLGLTIALWAAHGAAAPATAPVSSLARGFAAYRAGDYHDAGKALRAALAEKVRNDDWAAFLLGESEFYDGDYTAARAAFERAAHAHGGRVAAMAPFRIADCLWMAGDHAASAKAYARLVKKATPTTGDVALARFRMAEESAARDPPAPGSSSWRSRANFRRTRSPTRRCAERRRRPHRRRKSRRRPPRCRSPIACGAPSR